MKIKYFPLKNKYQSIEQIKRLSKKYADDIGELKKLSLSQYFDFLRRIPYKRDTQPVEEVSRPKYILKNNTADCKKKTILALSYFIKNGYKYRIVVSSTRLDGKIHHIFPQVLVDGEYKNFDATYIFYRLFAKKRVTNYEIVG